MLRSALRRGLAPAAVLALFALAPSAKADTFNFSTSGVFGGTDSIASGGTKLDFGSTEITFAANSGGPVTTYPASDPLAPTELTLGTFHITSTASGAGDTPASNDNFTITVTTNPGGTNSSLATINGTITQTGGHIYVVSFAQNPLFIGSDEFTFLNQYPISTTTAGGTEDLNVGAVAVPLPATASTGLALLGGLGLLGAVSALRRRRQTA